MVKYEFKWYLGAYGYLCFPLVIKWLSYWIIIQSIVVLFQINLFIKM